MARRWISARGLLSLMLGATLLCLDTLAYDTGTILSGTTTVVVVKTVNVFGVSSFTVSTTSSSTSTSSTPFSQLLVDESNEIMQSMLQSNNSAARESAAEFILANANRANRVTVTQTQYIDASFSSTMISSSSSTSSSSTSTSSSSSSKSSSSTSASSTFTSSTFSTLTRSSTSSSSSSPTTSITASSTSSTHTSASATPIQYAANLTTNLTGNEDYADDIISLLPSSAFTSVLAPTATSVPADLWDDGTCSLPAIRDATTDPTTRWDSVNASDAWIAATNYAAQKVANGTSANLSFPMLVSNFFQGPIDMHCEQLSARSGCGTTFPCFNPASGFLVLNSLGAISNLNFNVWQAIGNAQGNVEAAIGGFAATFSPQKDPSNSIFRILLDIFTICLLTFLSPIWNIALRGLEYFTKRANGLTTIKDAVTPMLSGSVMIVKDHSIAGLAMNAANDLSTNVGQMVQSWQGAIQAYNSDLFNGSLQSNAILYNQIDDGKVIGATFAVDEANITAGITETLFAMLVPRAWSDSNKGVNPFILDTGQPCEANLTHMDPSKFVDKGTLSAKNANQSWACLNNKMLFLVSASGESMACHVTHPTRYEVCVPAPFSLPPGLDSMDGTRWGGLTVRDIILGSYNSYAAHNYTNGAPQVSFNTTAQIQQVAENGIASPGVIRLPVCTANDAGWNWFHNRKKQKPYFPCN